MASSTGNHLFDNLLLPAGADFHVHLRQSSVMHAVTPTIQLGGVDTVYVMPNTIPPIDSVAAAVKYYADLKAIAPDVTFLMTLYLNENITPNTIREAKRSGIVRGVKSYPAGVTTNSSGGVVDYETFYSVFEEMEQEGLVLNLHGEVPSSRSAGVDVLNAEEKFLPTLRDLVTRFPRLRIVLEHCTTAAAVEAVKELAGSGAKVRGTITAHHMFLTVDDWAGNGLNFCKPVAKREEDRRALVRASVDKRGWFFLGTDSAPHLLSKKKGWDGAEDKCAAGVFTQSRAVQLVLEAWDEAIAEQVIAADYVTKEVTEGFLGAFGREFYGVEVSNSKVKVRLRRGDKGEENAVKVEGDDKGVPVFRQGKGWYDVEWV